MVWKCAIPTCKRTGDKNCGIKFHRFPLDESRRSQWIASIKKALPIYTFKKTHFVCENHFNKTDYNYNSNGIRKNLNRNAVPLIFEPYDIVVVNELPDISYNPLPKYNDQTPSKKSDFNLVQVSNELGCEPLNEANNTLESTFNMDNAQNPDNLNNVPMTSSSNSTYKCKKRSYTPKKFAKRMCCVGDFIYY